MVRFALRSLIVAAVALSLGVTAASAQDTRQNEPGKFDFYVLALSWSPSFCEAAGDRAQGQPECARLDRNIISSMLDVMPAPRLIFREWDRHGTCSGLPARAYFETVRKARAVVKIPAEYIDLKAPLTVTPAEVEQAFVNANPGLSASSIAVGCDRERLREIRICMSKELAFRGCEGAERRTCRREKIVMPPLRGGKPAREDG